MLIILVAVKGGVEMRKLINNETVSLIIFGIVGVIAIFVIDLHVDFFSDRIWYKYALIGILSSVILIPLCVIAKNYVNMIKDRF